MMLKLEVQFGSLFAAVDIVRKAWKVVRMVLLQWLWKVLEDS